MSGSILLLVLLFAVGLNGGFEGATSRSTAERTAAETPVTQMQKEKEIPREVREACWCTPKYIGIDPADGAEIYLDSPPEGEIVGLPRFLLWCEGRELRMIGGTEGLDYMRYISRIYPSSGE